MAKVLIIGLDGATFDLMTPWVQAGKLPNLAKLLRKGISGKLRSTNPPMSPPAWNSFMTGKNPGKHGVFDFTERKPKSYETCFINASWRKAPTICKYVSEAGKSVAAISIPFTYPPEKLTGIMISGMDAPGVAGLVDRSATYPPELCDEIRSKVGEYPMGANLFAYTDPKEMIEAIDRTMERKAATALYLYKKQEWDCFMFVLGETDAASHRFWRFCDPSSPVREDVPPDAEVANALFTVYEKADKIIGQFLEIVPSDTIVIIMSDHGQGGNSDKAVRLNQWLSSQGILKFKASNGLMSVGLGLGKQYGLRVLPARIKRLLYRFTNIPNKVETLVRFSAINWRKTLAYSEETPYFPSIWINLKGREPGGIVEEGEYDRVCEEIREKLTLWRDPYSGQRIVKHVYRRGEIYSGPHVEKAPDLIIEWGLDNGYSYLFRPSTGKRKPPVCKVDAWEKKKVKSGDHREEGIFIASGPVLKDSSKLKNAEIIDVAPTLLYLMGLPIPKDMDGKVLTEMFKEEYLMSHPTQYDSNGSGFDANLTEPHRGYSEEEEEALKARLKGLGYIE